MRSYYTNQFLSEDELKLVLELAGLGAQGLPFQGELVDDTYHWDRIISYSRENGIASFVFYSMQKSEKSIFPSAIVKMGAEENRRVALSQMMGREVVFEFLKQLDKRGFRPVLLKGCAVAECYAQPYLRVSHDTDVLIDGKKEKELYKYLTENGFSIRKRVPYEHHSQANHKQKGFFEFHNSLFSVRVSDYWKRKSGLDIFEKGKNEPCLLRTSQGDFIGMETTDQFIFVVLHFVKHYLSMEASVKMVLDICMYARHYFEEIDWNYFWNVCDRLAYRKLISAIFQFGKDYLKIEFSDGLFDELEIIDETRIWRFVNIVADSYGNNEVTSDFNDLYWAKQTVLNRNPIIHRAFLLWTGSIPFLFEYVKQYGVLSTLGQGLPKIKQIMTAKSTHNYQNEGLINERLDSFREMDLLT